MQFHHLHCLPSLQSLHVNVRSTTGPLKSTSAKINISYSILFNLTTSYSSYFGGKKGISRNKTSIFLLMYALANLQLPSCKVSLSLYDGVELHVLIKVKDFNGSPEKRALNARTHSLASGTLDNDR